MDEKNKNTNAAESAKLETKPTTPALPTNESAKSGKEVIKATEAEKPAVAQKTETALIKKADGEPAAEKKEAPKEAAKTEAPAKKETPAAEKKASDSILAAAATEAETGSRRPLIAFIAGMVTALIIWQLYTVITNNEPGPGEYPNPIATVGGVAIDQALFEQNVEQTLVGGVAQGLDIEDPEIRRTLENQALEVLINTRLLVNAAAAAGYNATDEEIAERIELLESQFGGAEGLDAELTSLGLDRENLQNDVSEQLNVDALLANDVLPETIDVSQEEIAEVYDGLVAAGQEMPPLETVRDAIVAQIEQQKQQDIIEAYLDELRAESDIEINL